MISLLEFQHICRFLIEINPRDRVTRIFCLLNESVERVTARRGFLGLDANIGPLLLENLAFGLLFGGIGIFFIYKKVKSEEYNPIIE